MHYGVNLLWFTIFTIPSTSTFMPHELSLNALIQLEESRVSGAKYDRGENHDKGKLNRNERKSYTAWMQNELTKDPVVKRLNQRFGALVGLELEPSEPLQVLNYDIGGNYIPHFDWGYVRLLFMLKFTLYSYVIL